LGIFQGGLDEEEVEEEDQQPAPHFCTKVDQALRR
jgi:hypothetical protein